MRLFRNALRVSMLEARLLRAFPKLRWSLLGVVVIPAFYAFIYLESVWDPTSHTRNLPAAIVNLDRGAMANGQAVNLGMDLAQTLKDKEQFGFYEEGDPDAARRAVRQGKSLFALVIPADFSAGAMAAGSPGAGKLVVFASEGNNYAGAGFAKRFAEELGHQVNESLNEKRWEVVLGASSSAADSLQRLHEGVARLREGAVALHSGMGKAEGGSAQLAKGATELSSGVAQLGDGMKQLGAGARTLDAKKPEAADLQALKAGARQLASGQEELRQALPQLEDGAQRLADGAGQLRDESKGLLFGGDKVSGAAGQLADGATQLHGGLQQASQGQARLAEGAGTLSQGVAQMADGFGAYSAGASTLAAKAPADAKVDQVVDGSKALAGAAGELRTGLLKVKDGSSQLVLGLDTLEASLPSGGPGMEGTASGLAISVKPQIEIDAPVKNNGMGLAPNFIPIALWLGAVMTAFIFHLRRLPDEAAGYSRISLLLGKLWVLWSVNLLQAACVLAMVWFMLGIQAVNTLGLALSMAVTSLTFMLVILALVRAFGDVGKAIALILMVLQLSSAGGVLPVELTSTFYRDISPWLPFTWSIKAVRASAFGALGGDWGMALAVLGLFAAGAFVFSLLVGQWKFVPPEEHKPAMDI